MAEKPKQIGSTTLVKYRIPKPFRVFGGNKTYADFNTTDEEVERLLKAEPQHLLRFTMADGSPVTLPLDKKKAEKKPAKQSEPTE